MLANVHYAIIMDQECEETGGIAESVSLRDAIEYLRHTRASKVISVIEANCCDPSQTGVLECTPNVTVYNGPEFESGEYENRTLVPCGPITAASWRRLARLIIGSTK